MFSMRYEIIPWYLTGPSKRRPCIPMPGVVFMVAHDTGNAGSTAAGNVSYYENSRNDQEASAHIFVDDKQIIECIPFLTAAPEKAWHVLYNVTTDNAKYGVNANDDAVGVELCYGGGIDMQEAYKRYIWVMAYSCYKYGLNPATAITGHFILDPARKTDPMNALKLLGKTFDDFIYDVVKEYNDCLEEAIMLEQLEQMKQELAEVKVKLAAVEEKQSMPSIPDWAVDAVNAAVAKGLLDSPEGCSYDVYRMLTMLYRKQII